MSGPGALQSAIERFPDDRSGNSGLALYLWGNDYSISAGRLRNLVVFFADIGVTDQSGLVAWAAAADFDRDFRGRVEGLGFAAFQRLGVRCGVDTVKPDVHTRSFCQACMGRRPTDREIVDLIVAGAARLGVPARSLDHLTFKDPSASA